MLSILKQPICGMSGLQAGAGWVGGKGGGAAVGVAVGAAVGVIGHTA